MATGFSLVTWDCWYCASYILRPSRQDSWSPEPGVRRAGRSTRMGGWGAGLPLRGQSSIRGAKDMVLSQARYLELERSPWGLANLRVIFLSTIGHP